MNSRPSESMAPHSGMGGAMPSPKKLSPAAVMITSPTPSVACTMTGARALGMMWWRMMLKWLSPTALAACTNSLLRTDSTAERTTRE